MAKSINFKTASKYLLNAVSKAPDKKKNKVLDDKFKIYKKRMIENAEGFFKTKNQVKAFEKYTLNTIEKKIKDHLKKGVYNQKELQRQINGVVTRGRDFQKRVLKNEKLSEMIKDSDEDDRYTYIITHAVKTGIHSDECANDLANEPSDGYTAAEADEIIGRKPNHVNCDCTVRKLPKKHTSKRFESGNF